jgi:hypothetical protein
MKGLIIFILFIFSEIFLASSYADNVYYVSVKNDTKYKMSIGSVSLGPCIVSPLNFPSVDPKTEITETWVVQEKTSCPGSSYTHMVFAASFANGDYVGVGLKGRTDKSWIQYESPPSPTPFSVNPSYSNEHSALKLVFSSNRP